MSGVEEGPMRGRFLEEFATGQRFSSHRRTITSADVATFVGVTGINDPLFTDAVFAARSPIGSLLVPGPLIMCATFGLTENLVYGTVVAALAITKCEFKSPLIPGDTIWADTVIGEVRPSATRPGLGIVELRHVVSSDRTAALAAINRTMLCCSGEYYARMNTADDATPRAGT